MKISILKREQIEKAENISIYNYILLLDNKVEEIKVRKTFLEMLEEPNRLEILSNIDGTKKQEIINYLIKQEEKLKKTKKAMRILQNLKKEDEESYFIALIETELHKKPKHLREFDIEKHEMIYSNFLEATSNEQKIINTEWLDLENSLNFINIKMNIKDYLERENIELEDKKLLKLTEIIRNYSFDNDMDLYSIINEVDFSTILKNL